MTPDSSLLSAIIPVAWTTCGVPKPATWSDLRLGCRGFVLVDEAAEDWPTTYRGAAWLCDRVVRSWWGELSGLVGSAVVVVGRVAVQDRT